MRDIFSFKTLKDVTIPLLTLALQLVAFAYQLEAPFEVSKLRNPEVADQYWPMYDYAQRGSIANYCMTMSLVVMFTEIIIMLKSFKVIENFLLSI
jgi:hypothetical protein